jgi:hypothetical protein
MNIQCLNNRSCDWLSAGVTHHHVPLHPRPTPIDHHTHRQSFRVASGHTRGHKATPHHFVHHPHSALDLDGEHWMGHVLAPTYVGRVALASEDAGYVAFILFGAGLGCAALRCVVCVA